MLTTALKIAKRFPRFLGQLDVLHYQRSAYEPWFNAYRTPKVGHGGWRHCVVRFGDVELHWSAPGADRSAREEWLEARRNFLRQTERNAGAEAVQ